MINEAYRNKGEGRRKKYGKEKDGLKEGKVEKTSVKKGREKMT